MMMLLRSKKITLHMHFLVRFMLYVSVITIFFVFLFNFVEFFEKLLRVKHAGVGEILYFLWLNLAPSFIEQLPTSTWLATCFFIRELYQHQEFQTLLFLGVRITSLGKLFLFCGALIASISLVINEYFVVPLSFKVEHYKMEHFKQMTSQRIINKWLPLNQQSFFHFGFLNLDENKGQDLFLIYTTADCLLEKTISASTFYLLPAEQEIVVEQGKLFDVEHNMQHDINDYHVVVPSFFSQLKILRQPPTMMHLFASAFFNKKIIPFAVYNDLLRQLFDRLLHYFLIFIYPFFTLTLFGLWLRSRYKWAALLLPYPFFIGLRLLSSSLMSCGVSALGAYTVWLMFGGILWAFYRRLD